MENITATLNDRLKAIKDKKPAHARAKTQRIADLVYEQLNWGEDMHKHYPLIVRLVKNFGEGKVLSAVSYCKDYPRTRNQLRLFMWRLKCLGIENRRSAQNSKPTVPSTHS